MAYNSLNIFHVSGYPYHAGGIDTWLHNFLLNNTEIKIRLFCPDPLSKTPQFDTGSFKNLEIIYTGKLNGYKTIPSWSLKAIFKITGKLLNSAPCLVLSTIPTLMPLWVLKKIGRIRSEIICSVRGCLVQDAIDTGKNRLFVRLVKDLEGTLLKICDTITANGWDTGDYLQNVHKIESLVIPNGITVRNASVATYDHELAELKEISKKKKIVLHLGTLREIKGIDYIISACRQLKEKRDDFIIVFVGKGKIEEYKHKTEKLGINSYFTGNKSNINDYLKIADVVINVSGGGGVSNSLLEAMESGRIVVAWNKKTFSQVISHGENGILAEYRNTADLADKINCGISNNMNIDNDAVVKSVEMFKWQSLNQKWKEVLKIN